MKLKLIFGLMVAANLSTAVYAEPTVKTPRAKPTMPPLPPGAAYTEEGKLVATADVSQKGRKAKEAAVAAADPLPGSKIDEPAGAALPEKKQGDGAPK